MSFEANPSNERGPVIPPEVLAGFAEMARSVSAIYSQMVSVLEPQVSRVIETSSTDVAVIESLLDQLLDICDDAQALKLYRSLCRDYWTISQPNTAFYINAYRSMWDDGSNSQSRRA